MTKKIKTMRISKYFIEHLTIHLINITYLIYTETILQKKYLFLEKRDTSLKLYYRQINYLTPCIIFRRSLLRQTKANPKNIAAIANT